VIEEELTNLLLNCKKIGSSLNSHILVQDRTKTPPSSPVLKEEKESGVHQDPIMSFVSHIVTTTEPVKDVLDDMEAAKDIDKEIEIKSSDEKDDDNEKKGIFKSIKKKMSDAFSNESSEGKVSTVKQVECEDNKDENSQSSGFLSSIKSRVGGFFSTQAENKSDDEVEVEEIIESLDPEETCEENSNDTLPNESYDKTSKTTTLDTQLPINNSSTILSSDTKDIIEEPKSENISLDSTYASGYHFDTPPHIGTESEIHPCGIDGSLSSRTTVTTSSDGPSSIESKLLSTSSEIAYSETSSSSEYKGLTEISSISTETKNVEILKEAQIDSSTEDQLSSGNFSTEESSPRYAELPLKLKKVITSDNEVDEVVHKTDVRKMSGKLLSMDTRSTSIASDVSDQEIPPSTPRSDLTSPTTDAVKFVYGEKGEHFAQDTVDIMTQSIYMPSNEQTMEDSQDKGNMSVLASILHTTEVVTNTVVTTEIVSQNSSSETKEEKEIKSEITKQVDEIKEIHTENVIVTKLEEKSDLSSELKKTTTTEITKENLSTRPQPEATKSNLSSDVESSSKVEKFTSEKEVATKDNKEYESKKPLEDCPSNEPKSEEEGKVSKVMEKVTETSVESSTSPEKSGTLHSKPKDKTDTSSESIDNQSSKPDEVIKTSQECTSTHSKTQEVTNILQESTTHQVKSVEVKKSSESTILPSKEVTISSQEHSHESKKVEKTSECKDTQPHESDKKSTAKQHSSSEVGKVSETSTEAHSKPVEKTSQEGSTQSDAEDPISSWGKPLGLPSPIRPSTPAKHTRKTDEETVDTNKLRDSVEPVWMDLAYVPHHGCKNYVDAEFFKRVRARYYVFSGVEPSKDVFNALLEGKKTWENKEQEVTIIPTYDTDVLGYWVAENEDLLTELKIDLAPSASRCTINLQDHETSCAAYRLEF